MSDPVNVLVAYPYAKKNVLAVLAENQQRVRFLLDSGAFTAWKAGKPIALDDYCRFIDALPIKPWRYFTLDVIGDPEATMRNYEVMLQRGYTPVPIFTRGEDISVLNEYYKTSDVVGLGGLVGTRGNKGFVNGIMKHVGQRKVHLLGFTNAEYMKFYRPYMCDSSSWKSAFMYGRLNLYKGRSQFVTVGREDFMSKPTKEVIDLLLAHGIDPAQLSTAGNWSGGSGKYPTEVATARAFVRYQRDITKQLGTNYFLACCSDWEIRLLVEASKFWEGKKQ